MSGRLRALVHRVNKLQESLVDDQQRMWVGCLREEETGDASLARHGITPGPHDLIVFLQAFASDQDCDHCRQAGDDASSSASTASG